MVYMELNMSVKFTQVTSRDEFLVVCLDASVQA